MSFCIFLQINVTNISILVQVVMKSAAKLSVKGLSISQMKPDKVRSKQIFLIFLVFGLSTVQPLSKK